MKQIRPGMKEYQMERYYNKTKKKEKKKFFNLYGSSNLFNWVGFIPCEL